MELKEAINNIEDVLTNYHANTILRDRLLPVLTFLRELESSDSNEAMEWWNALWNHDLQDADLPPLLSIEEYTKGVQYLKSFILQAQATKQELAELKEKVLDLLSIPFYVNLGRALNKSHLKNRIDELKNLCKGSE